MHVLDSRRKPEYPERTHAYTGGTCKLHTGRPQPGVELGTLSLWGKGANHHTKVQPPWELHPRKCSFRLGLFNPPVVLIFPTQPCSLGQTDPCSLNSTLTQVGQYARLQLLSFTSYTCSTQNVFYSPSVQSWVVLIRERSDSLGDSWQQHLPLAPFSVWGCLPSMLSMFLQSSVM